MEEMESQQEFMQDHLYEYLEDIRVRVMNELEIDQAKWGEILSEFVLKAIHTVKPRQFEFSDQIDITKYVKI